MVLGYVRVRVGLRFRVWFERVKIPVRNLSWISWFAAVRFNQPASFISRARNAVGHD